MIVQHVKPETWVDTGEAGKVQPSEVAGLVHVVELEPEDLETLRGPAGPQGAAPAGAVLHFAMAAAPAGWLVCNGAAVSRATYAALFAAIGTVFGAGDGATTFKLPDLRGEFLRGLDDGRGVDVGRVLGSAQAGGTAAHTHNISRPGMLLDEGVIGGSGNVIGCGARVGESSMSIYSGSSGGTETRPRNIALLPCISTGGV